MNFQSTNKHIPLLEDYYNHFDEEKRLDKRHGYIEFYTNMSYIEKYLKPNSSILDVGAGTGKYAIPLFLKGHNVTAIELMEKHVKIIKNKNKDINAYQGNALNLNKEKNNSYDMVILFGPMYHLLKEEERIIALNEAKRVVKDDGVILISYCGNEYALITYGFKKNMIKKCLEDKLIDEDFHSIPGENDLYTYLRLEDIDRLNEKCGLKRVEIISSDGPADYLRTELNKMDQETYDLFLQYHLKTCFRKELIGASAHILDIVKKK